MTEDSAKAPQTREVRIAAIYVGERLRPLREDAVAELMGSMRERGLIQPITIGYPNGQATPELVAGAHRLEAATRLGWETIRCEVRLHLSAADAKLIEIDENLIRNDLSPAERAIHTGERKRYYEEKHPQTKHGGDRKSKSQAEILKAPAFVDDTAAKTGKSRATVSRDAGRAKNIPDIRAVVGTSLDSGEELDALAKLAPERQAPLIERAKAGQKVSAKVEVKKVRRAERESELGEAMRAAAESLGTKPYGVIYADPNWRFEPYSRETGMDRAADNHYPTSPTEVIAAMKVPAADNCVLFLWATAPMLPDALRVMTAWGFEYKTNQVWAKDQFGTGYWFRNQHEHLLVGVRGDIPAPAMGDQFASLIEAAVGRHSHKPAIFAEMIEEMFPNLPRLEMFARGPRDGWDVWGNEALAEAA